MTRLRGNEVNKDNVVAVVQRLVRRAPNKPKAKAMITPYPISSENPLQFLFPTKGKVVRVVIYVEGMAKEGVLVTLGLTTGDTVTKTEQSTIKKLMWDLDIDVSPGALLEIHVDSLGEDFHRCFIACLWRPSVKDAVVKKFLVEELDKEEESNET